MTIALSNFSFVAMTYNLWADFHLDNRRDALTAFFTIRPPDLLAVQELRPSTRKLLDDALPDHDRVDGTAGWETQSNLWWRRDLFTPIESGAEDVGILSPDARLFWVRLRAARRTRTDVQYGASDLARASGRARRSRQPPGRPGTRDRGSPGTAGRRRCVPVHRRHQRHRPTAVGARQRRVPGQFHRTRPGTPPVTHPVVPTVATGPIGTRLSPSRLTAQGDRLDLRPRPARRADQRGRRVLPRRPRPVRPLPGRRHLHVCLRALPCKGEPLC